MAEFTVVSERFEQGRLYYSFLVDGTPSLKWFPECKVEGLAPTYHVDRCISRLKAGRSREAFGPAPEVSVGGVPLRTEDDSQETKALEAMKSAGVPESLAKQAVEQLKKLQGKGRGRVYSEEGKAPEGTTDSGKPRTARPVWRYSLDGKPSEKTFPTEAAAREACATAAFMTRGKLGRLAEVKAALEAQFPGVECKVWACKGEHCVRAKAGEVEYLIGWEPDGTFRFKPRLKKE